MTPPIPRRAPLPALVLACAAGCAPGPTDPGDTATPPCADAPDVEGWVTLFTRVFAAEATSCDLEHLAAWVEAARARKGQQPWDTELRVAVAPPGGVFEASGDALVPFAGVPEAVSDDDGRTWLFHVDGDLDRLLEEATLRSDYFLTHGWVGQGALALAVSDDGTSFVREEAFGVEGIVQGMVVDPDVVRLPDGTWRMYYVALSLEEYFLDEAAWAPDAWHRVFAATSEDLVHWVQVGEVVRGPWADPTIRCWDERECRMASFGLDWATSSDGGLDFTFEDRDDPRGFAPEFTALPDGRTRLWYNSTEPGAPVWSLVSDDRGASWTREPGEWLPGAYGEAPSVIVDPDGAMRMYFHTFQDPDDIPSRRDASD